MTQLVAIESYGRVLNLQLYFFTFGAQFRVTLSFNRLLSKQVTKYVQNFQKDTTNLNSTLQVCAKRSSDFSRLINSPLLLRDQCRILAVLVVLSLVSS